MSDMFLLCKENVKGEKGPNIFIFPDGEFKVFTYYENLEDARADLGNGFRLAKVKSSKGVASNKNCEFIEWVKNKNPL